MQRIIRLLFGVCEERPRRAREDTSMLVLRLGFGATMLFGHGLPKLLSYSESAEKFPDPIGLGGPLSMALVIFAEFFCSIALMTGFLTRLALLPLIFNMGVALFVVHGGAEFKVMELALVYLLVYVAVFLHGAGRWSIDEILLKYVKGKYASGQHG